jgi:pimeloyl-ACP methyl ester carboxylesterase
MSARANIVLIHGAWADGSSWSAVIERLQADGYRVTAPQFPLTALADDAARLHQVLALQDSPTVVAGHFYGGQIMTALGTDAANISGMVYIAAFGLDQGESLGELLSQGTVTPGAGAPVHRQAGLRLAVRGRLRRPFRRERRPGQGKGDACRAAAAEHVRLRGCDARAGAEIPCRPGIWSPPTIRRSRPPPSASSLPAWAPSPWSPVQPRPDGLPPRRRDPAH